MMTFVIRLTENKLALTATGILILLIAFAITAPWLAPDPPLAIDLDHIKEAPSGDHLFGTDSKGRDIFSRILYGARVSLTAGLLAAAVSTALGLLVGLCAGYFRGRTDLLLSALLDIVLAFPGLLLVIAISVVLPPGLGTAIFALSLVGWASFARLFRGQVLSLDGQAYMESARAIGGSHLHIFWRHLLPNLLPLAGVVFMMKIGGFMLAEAALSFLGLGVQPPTASWGAMINLDRIYIHSAPWMVIFPGLALSITVMACNIIGDFLRDYLDPKMKI